MKRTIQNLIPITIFLLFFSAIHSQIPAPWQGLITTNKSATLSGQVTILGFPAATGDYIASFNQAGDLTGVTIIGYQSTTNTAYFALIIYGDEGAVTSLMAPGEYFTLQVYDASEGLYYQFGLPPSQVGPWFDQNGGPLTNITIDGNDVTNGFFNLLINVDVLLPIELGAFGVQKRSCNSFLIEWTTETEVNNEYFTVERSIDDIYSFESIGRVEGAGNSLEKSTYTFEDELSLKGYHKIYYRLKQTDYDGKQSFSNIIVDEYNCGSEGKFAVYPSPFNFELNLSIEDYDDSQVRIYDSRGVLVYSNENLNEPSLIIRTDDWTAGIYFVSQFLNGEIINTQRIIKQN